jgi:hypothetical protein
MSRRCIRLAVSGCRTSDDCVQNPDFPLDCSIKRELMLGQVKGNGVCATSGSYGKEGAHPCACVAATAATRCPNLPGQVGCELTPRAMWT